MIPRKRLFIFWLLIAIGSFSHSQEAKNKDDASGHDVEPELAEDLFVTIEARGIDRVLKQAGSVASLFNPLFSGEMLRPMLGGALMSPDLADFNLERSFFLAVPATATLEDTPPVILTLPLKGDGFKKQMERMMDLQDLGEGDEGLTRYSPKAGRGGGIPGFMGMPSLMSTTWFGKQLGDTLVLGTEKKPLQRFLKQKDPLSTLSVKAPGAVALRLHLHQLVPPMRAMLMAQVADTREMWKQFENQDQDDFGFNPGPNPADLMEQTYTLYLDFFDQIENLEMGLEAKNDLFTLCTVATPEAESLLATIVGDMKPASEPLRRAIPHEPSFAYVGNWSHLNEAYQGFFEFIKGMTGDVGAAIAAGKEDKKEMKRLEKEMLRSQKILIGNMDRDIGFTLHLDNDRPESLAILDLVTAKPYQTFIQESTVEKLDPDGPVTQYIPDGTRKRAGSTIEKFRVVHPEGFMKMAGPLNLGAETMEFTTAPGDIMVQAASPAQMDQALDGLAGKGTLFEKRGAFGDLFPELKKVPSSMISVDLIALMTFTYQQQQQAMARQFENQGIDEPFDAGMDFFKGLPKSGGRLVGCGMKFGDNYLRLDRMGTADMMQMVQWFTGYTRNMQRWTENMRLEFEGQIPELEAEDFNFEAE